MGKRLERVNRRLRKARRARDRTRKDLRGNERDVKRIRASLKAEREVIRDLQEHRDEIRAALREEAELDAKGKGERGEAWEQRQAARLDGIADEIDESRAQVDRLLERIDTKKELRAKLAQELKGQEKRIAELRERRAQIKANREGRVSAHFNIREFDCHNGQRCPEQSMPALKDWAAKVGEPLRARFGPVHVNSGFRPSAYNASIGGEPNSVHIYDYAGRSYQAVAVDLVCARGTPAEWFAFTAGRADGRGRYSTFHHADNRNRIGWPDAVWYG